jgi:8-oxo-dGTP pyrophosphatase MutT (NUDIX family)
MTIWRPPKNIRVIAIGLAWRDGRLLATEVKTDRGTVQGVRPVGGGIEYGETREEALHREFMEELGAEISIIGPWHVLENFFEHEGVLGHEIVFAANIAFANRSFYERDEIIYPIENGELARAIWVAPAELAAQGIALYPLDLDSKIGWDR